MTKKFLQTSALALALGLFFGAINEASAIKVEALNKSIPNLINNKAVWKGIEIINLNGDENVVIELPEIGKSIIKDIPWITEGTDIRVFTSIKSGFYGPEIAVKSANFSVKKKDIALTVISGYDLHNKEALCEVEGTK